MARAVVMPRAGISVESCIIGAWKKAPGDRVALGEVLFDYETDKASFECESTEEGVLLECFFQEGDEVPCLTAVCAIGELGEDASHLRPDGDALTAETGQPGEEPETSPAMAAAAGAETTGERRVPGGVSPRARALAERLGLDPAGANPTGPYDRVIARDIEALAASRTGTGFGGRSFDEGDAAAEVQTVDSGAAAEYQDEKFTNIRKTIAAQMQKSLREMAQLTNHHSFDASAILAYRKTCKGGEEALGTGGITLNDMVLFAVARTLGAHPDLNAHLIGDDVYRRFSAVHLGFAVDTPRGLMVPTIFNAHAMSLKALSQKVKELAALCQGGRISPDLLFGATFTVSNLGALEVELFTPIINPPQVAILGVAGITTRVREGSGGIETYPAMGLSLTYDHRAVDGAPASRFVRDLSHNLAQFNLLLAL